MDSSLRNYVASEQLKGFSAVQLCGNSAYHLQSEWLKQFGEPKCTCFTTIQESFDFLFPVKTFSTRYLVLGFQEWSLLLTDMYDENCFTDAYAISRASNCRGIGITYRKNERLLYIFEEGQHIRQVESCLDEDRWHYLEWGQIQPFEDIEETLRRKKRDRLSVLAICSYFKRYTGMDVPGWGNLKPTQIFGIERSLKDLQVSVGKFETIRDI